MNDKNQTNIDDLIGTGGGQPIIVQENGSDKKFLYTLLILLVILFIIAIAVIAFLGSKYFSSNNAIVQNNTPKQIATVKNNAIANEQKAVQKQNSADNVNNTTLKELENLVKEEEGKQSQKVAAVNQKRQKSQNTQQQTIAKVANAAAGGTLSQEDLAKIAKLVAQELAKRKMNATNNNQNVQSAADSDKALVASLENAQADTLKNQNIDTTNLKDSNVNASNTKKVDTFNKVIINKKANEDDELAKLSSEIDTILQSEEVTKEEKSLKYGKELKQEVKRRRQALRFIVVKKGDTLSSIAYRAYGRASAYKKIYEANPDLIKNPNKIYVGMRLRVPVDDEYLKQQQGR